jgi:DNA polymerase-4
MATLRAFPVLVEVQGQDEAFVGGDIDDPQRWPPTSRRRSTIGSG